MKKLYLDIGENYALSFQSEASPISIGIVDLHNKIMYVLIIIFIIVSYLLLKIINSKYNYLNRIKFFNHNQTRILEFIWTIIPAFILIIIAIPSFKLLYSLENEDWITPNLTIKITGYQWYWNYELSDIKNININFDSYTKMDDDLSFGDFRLLDVDNLLYLPIHTPIRLLITSQDVIHSFFIPSFGIKLDAIPGRINSTSLYILREGLFTGQCAELCGDNHSNMSILIKGTKLKLFNEWLITFA
jgi:cytochrome c oxidase subunit 2